MEKYRTIGRRFLALIIDILVMIPFVLIEHILTSENSPPIISVVGLLVSVFCYHFYSIYLHARFGQTLGKMAMKIIVLDSEERLIGFHQSFLRELPLVLLTISMLVIEIRHVSLYGINEDFRQTIADNVILLLVTVWLISDTIVTLVNQRHRALHDFIAGTVVVRFPTIR